MNENVDFPPLILIVAGARDSSSDSATQSSPVSPTISNGFSPTHRVGRRNYREEEAARFGNSEHVTEKMKMIKDEKTALIAEVG